MDISEIEVRINNSQIFGYLQLCQIPEVSGIYFAWLEGETRCFYIGKAGNIKKRIRDHFSGQRGSDQFCLYVYDRYIHHKRCLSDENMTTKQVNEMTAEWIKKKIKFQCVEISSQEAESAERYLKLKMKPILFDS